MSDITVTIGETLSTQGINILDTTNYSGIQANLNYIKVNITDPNGVVTSFGNNITDSYIPPVSNFSGQPYYNFASYALAGVYTVQYIVSVQYTNTLSPNYWVAGFVFWWNGNYYLVVNSIAVAGGNTAIFITVQIAAGNLQLVQEAQLPGSYTIFGNIFTYIAIISFPYYGNLLNCLIDKLSKWNCNNKCESKKLECIDDLDIILQLTFIYQYVTLNNLNPSDQSQLATIIYLCNYINTICNCKNCKC